MAGQPPRAGGDRNQDGALCAVIPSVCRAAGNGRQRRSLTSKSQLLSMAEALSRLIPNADGRLILVIRHRQACDFAVAATLRLILRSIRSRSRAVFTEDVYSARRYFRSVISVQLHSDSNAVESRNAGLPCRRREALARETVEKAFRGEREETQAASFQSLRVS